jgi:methylmalonyl-CoA/ethylmalonyl-CoA epimerase
MIKQISHIGIATKNLEQATDLFRSAFHVEASAPIAGGDILVSMVQVGNCSIELMQPRGNEGVVARFLKKRGEGIHHICFEVDDIASELKSLKAFGLEPVKEPAPGAEGLSAFLYPRGTFGVLIELVQKD